MITVASPSLSLGESPLTVEGLAQYAKKGGAVSVTPSALERNLTTRAHLHRRLQQGEVIYGVTTGFGDSCEVAVDGERIQALPSHLFRFHQVGTGNCFPEVETRAIMLARLASLVTGYSAVRPELIQRLSAFLTHDILPCIPELGSVGASGDLTPLAYIAAALAGETEVSYQGKVLPSRELHEVFGWQPLSLEPKESLALMNGTSAMTGLSALALIRSERLAHFVARLTALTSFGVGGRVEHFDARLFEAKPHPGQAKAARDIRDALFGAEPAPFPLRVQDRYSLRCAPHVIGVLLDFMPLLKQIVEVELGSANDNPLIDPETGEVLHGGNFYGGHIAQVMDSLKTMVANLGDLMDRQLVLLCHPSTSGGLPANLSGASGPDQAAHHGFKAVQIATSALTAEALKLTMPASVFSRSTENHNQDKVSMGTIAARDGLRVLDLVETVAAMLTLGACQALDLRVQAADLRARAAPPKLEALHKRVRALAPAHTQDRRMDREVAKVLAAYRAGQLDDDLA